jgi:hypothetical protein
MPKCTRFQSGRTTTPNFCKYNVNVQELVENLGGNNVRPILPQKCLCRSDSHAGGRRFLSKSSSRALEAAQNAATVAKSNLAALGRKSPLALNARYREVAIRGDAHRKSFALTSTHTPPTNPKKKKRCCCTGAMAVRVAGLGGGGGGSGSGGGGGAGGGGGGGSLGPYSVSVELKSIIVSSGAAVTVGTAAKASRPIPRPPRPISATRRC